jgi:hypothetical protein
METLTFLFHHRGPCAIYRREMNVGKELQPRVAERAPDDMKNRPAFHSAAGFHDDVRWKD